MSVSISTRINTITLCCFIGFLLLSVVGIFAFQWISTDAPYYLSVARDVSRGNILYRDIINDYTPLVIYFFGGLFTIFKSPTYSVFLTAQVLVIAAGAYTLTRILRERTNGSTNNVAIVTLIYCVAVLSSDGSYINIEVYSSLFVLVACYAMLVRKALFLAGALLGCSFLCKQYGILNFVPFAVYLLWTPREWRQIVRNGILLGLGGMLPVAITWGYVASQGVDTLSLLQQISGSRYAGYSAGRSRSLASLFIGAKVFLAFLLMPVIYLVRAKANRELIFCVVGIIVNLVPIVFQGFQHYYINTLPYLFILCGIILADVNVNRYLHMLFLGAGVFSAALFAGRILRYADVGANQEATASMLRGTIPQGSPVFIEGPMRYLYLTNDYRNPVLSTIGYDYTYFDTDGMVDSRRTFTIMSYKEYVSPHTTIITPMGVVHIYSP